MKKTFLLLAFSLLGNFAFSQSMIFCEKITEDGKPVNPSHIFRIVKDGGTFQLLAILDKAANTQNVKIDIFRVDETGKEKWDASVDVEVSKDWIWFSKELIFYKGGDYTVYAYTAEDKLLCTGMVKVVMQ